MCFSYILLKSLALYLFSECYSKTRGNCTFLGTIFSAELKNIFCSSEYLLFTASRWLYMSATQNRYSMVMVGK